MIWNAKNSGDTTLLVIPNSGSVLTITNQNVIILCGFTTQTFSINDIRLIRISIVLQNFLHMCNISIIYTQTFRLTNYANAAVHSLHQLRLWPTAAQPLVHKDPLQVGDSALAINAECHTELAQEAFDISHNTRGDLPTTWLQSCLTNSRSLRCVNHCSISPTLPSLPRATFATLSNNSGSRKCNLFYRKVVLFFWHQHHQLLQGRRRESCL